MAMVVKNNMSAISTLNTLNKNSSALAKSLEKVSSGMKINSAADDASGYAISERMRVQIRSLDQANANTQAGNSMMKVAEGAVSSTVDILKTLKEKVINAANDTNTDDDRATIQKELNQSIDQIDDNANITYNGKYLVDGSKNTIGTITCTAMTNQSLNTATKGSSDFTALKNANGESLEIVDTDKVTMSYTHQGKTYTCTVKVSEAVSLSKMASLVHKVGTTAGDDASFVFTTAGTSVIGTAASGKTVYTADGSSAISLQSKCGGIAGQIAGFNIRITDNEGNVKKSANAALDAFTEQVTAQNESQDNALTFQVGAKANQSIKVGLGDMRSEALGLKGSDGTKLNISTQEKANAAVNVLDNAVQKALNQQTTIGAVESRLNYTSTNLTTASENVQASESTIRDADMAKEMTNYTKNNVLLQAAQSMLAQANQSSSSVLSLLQ
jgi:flagellin